MKILLLLIANIILVSCSVELDTDFNELHSLNLFDFKKNCTKPEIMCKSCKELILCTEIETGKFEEMELQLCNVPQETCLINKCSTDPNPLCPGNTATEFKCTATAMFPDPYNCNIYHICAKKIEEIKEENNNDEYYHYVMTCDNDYGYDPITTYCKVPLKNNACPEKLPVPACTKLGQTGALTNPSIYYICKSTGENQLAPELHLCPHGKKYVAGKCT